MALGVFTSADAWSTCECSARPTGLIRGDLLLYSIDYSLDDLEQIAAQKGAVRQLLDETWRKVYQANAPRGLFTASEVRVAWRWREIHSRDDD